MPIQDTGAVEGESNEFLQAPTMREVPVADIRKEIQPLKGMDQLEKFEELQGQRDQLAFALQVGNLGGVGVNSLKYSDMSAHAALSHERNATAAAVRKGALQLKARARGSKRRTFAWREPPHPLLQHTLSTNTAADVVAAFRSPALGALRMLVFEHVVQGVVIFPGAGYLEMAHVACRAARPAAEGAALRGVFFLQPLALADDATALQVECVLRTGGNFEVRSGELVAAEVLEGATVHCNGSVAPAVSGAWQNRGIAMARSCRTRPVDVAALYRDYASIGLQYGHAFRTLARAWAGNAEGVARLSTRAAMSGTRVHPADLDGALQLGAVLAKGEAGNARGGGAAAKPRLPFAVDEALLRGGVCHEKWATVSAQGGDRALVALAEASGRVLAKLDGFTTRILGTVPTKAQQRHFYLTEWRMLPSGAVGAEPGATVAPVLVLGRSRSFDNDRVSAMANGLAPKRSQPLIALHSSTEDVRALPELEGTLALVQAAAATAPPSTLLLITVGAQLEGKCSPLHVMNTGVWGLARAARAEARLSLRCVDIETGCAIAQLIGVREAKHAAEPELVLRDSVQWVPRLASATSPSSGLIVLGARGPHLVSGGLGGLGLLAARWLAQQGADGLALASRSGAVAATMQSEWEQLRESTTTALVERCDVAEEADTCRMMAKVQCKLASLRGVWHAAGVLADGLLPKLTAEALRHVFAPKAHGAWALHSASAAAELRSCALFSSVAALLGGAGQANYSAANTCLDALGACRRMQGRVATSVQWGAWAEVGMAARGPASERTAAMEASSGFGRIGVVQGLEALHEAVQPGGPAVLGVLPVVWSRLLGSGAAVPALLSAFAPERARAQAAAPGPAETVAMSISSKEVSLEAVLEMVRRTAGGAVDADTPLMEAGIDSLGAVELRNQLQQAAGESVALPSTLVFDHPTARQLAALLQGSTAESPTVTIPTSSMREATSVVLAAVRALLPLSGSSSTNMWQYAACGSDLVSTVPSSRWSINDEQVMALAARAPSMLYGGFLSDAELFDNSFFGISRAEAAVMDPQQRLLLEHGYAVLHDVGFSRVNLSGSDTGVFVGVWASEYADVLASTSSGKSVYAATAATCSVVVGRISFVLGLMGPCISYDTACSSGLVACHAAMRALQHYECTTALAAGVNMIFSPSASATTGLAGMTSPTGKSYSFDLRADGYVRGEACCPAVMKRSEADPSKAPSVLANAVRQDGRSASLTAPNGTAQQGLLSAALADAALVPAALSLNEAHGTGTALGDPIEVGSLAAAVLKKREAAGGPPLALGGVKANIGHAEPAAGMTGLLKLALALKASGAAPNAQLRRLNPHVDAALRGSGCALPAQLASLPRGKGGEWTAGGVSSFGYSGTIAHAVLSHAHNDTAATRVKGALQLEARPTLGYKRRTFAWREPPHPLLQHTLAATTSTDVVAAFRSPALGALRALVIEHVVQGVVVFPGAGYLEMAHVACRAARPTAEGAALRGVFFLQPLALAEDARALQVECALRAGGNFEVRSGELVAAEEALEGATTHCSGSIAPASIGAWRPHGIAMARSCRTRPVDVAAMYRDYASIGLQYGRAFRTLARAWAGGAEGVARLLTRAAMSGTRVHPADLDGALQLSAVLAKGRTGNSSDVDVAAKPRLPFAVDEALLRGGVCREQWATVSAQGGDSTLVALAEAGGRGLAELDGFKTRTLGTAPTKAQQRHLYLTEWRTLSSGAVGAEPEAAVAPVLVLGRSRSFEDNPSSAMADGLAPGRSQALIALHSSTEEVRALPELEGTLALVQATAATAPPSALLLITVGAQLEGKSSPLRLVNTGVWGLARAARAEARLPLRCVDIDTGCAIAQLIGAREAENAAEPELVLRDGIQRVPRLKAAPTQQGQVQLSFHTRGAVSNLFIELQPDLFPPEHGDVLMSVRAVGLNFRDVLNVLGEYPGDPGPPGADCAGTIIATGAAGLHAAGSAVFGLGHAPLATVAHVKALLLAPKALTLSFEQASTLPITWSTTHVALKRARLRRSHALAVQAAAGGVGLKAIEYAHWLGVGVLGSAGRPQKQQLLHSLGVRSLCSSRDGGVFAVGSAQLLRGGRMHGVLNSLSNDFIAASLGALGEKGCFGEIGKRGIWSSGRFAASARRSQYEPIAVDADMSRNLEWMHGVLELLSMRALKRVARSLPLCSFDLEKHAYRAFRVLQHGLNIGKVVVRIAAKSDAEASARGSHLVSGGAGGLGLLVARWLAQQGADGLALASRSGAVAASMQSEWEQLRASTTAALVERCDVTEEADACRMMTKVQCKLAPLRGMWHAAGVIADGLLPRLTAETLRHVFGPKAHGAWALHSASSAAELRSCALFSSAAALLGGAGQANYSAANTCLDALGASRRMQGRVATSVQWGAWAEVGMAARGAASERAAAMEASSSFGRIGVAQGLEALREAVQPGGPAVLGVLPVVWSRLLGGGAAVPALLSAFAPERSRAHAAEPGSAETVTMSASSKDVSLEAVLEMVRRTAGGAVDADAPLMEAGIDSLGAVELRNQLQQAAGESVALPSTLIFDHPTARQLTTALQPQKTERRVTDAEMRPPPSSLDSHPVMIAGMSALLPGGIGSHGAMWLAASSGHDAIGEVPASRWELGTLSTPSELVACRIRHGGFVLGAERFDNAAFAISPAEAAAMDPQQRLLLEHGYEAMHGAQLDRAALNGSLTGVFLGIAAAEFGQILAAAPAGKSVYAATGSTNSVASGRLSYVLGLHGPCVSYDTACSAALVACHAALCALQRGECGVALAAGVNLMLAADVGYSFAVAGMTSALGRSHTFDERADGYARGEACGVVVLSTCKADEDVALGLNGSSVRQDGRSASLTAPNGSAQQGLLSAALADAALVPAALSLNEAHGTGTALGDPIEAGSLAAAVLKKRADAGAPPLALGGVKANIGHAEPAAGMTGLLKLALALEASGAAPNAQLHRLNPHVDAALRGSCCALPAQLASLPRGKGGEWEAGGVSSFGYSGTIAHAILSHNHNDTKLAVRSGALHLKAHPAHALKRRVFAWRDLQCAQDSDESVSAYIACWAEAPPLVHKKNKSLDGVLVLSLPADPLKMAERQSQRIDAPTSHTAPEGLQWRVVAALLNGSDSAAPSVHGVQLVLVLAKLLTRSPQPPRLLILTAGTQSPCAASAPSSAVATAHGGVWGLARVLRQEHPTLHTLSIDVMAATLDVLAEAAPIASDNMVANDTELSQNVSRKWHAARLRRGQASVGGAAKLRGGLHVVTGGLGGLGLRAATLLLEHGAAHVALASRSGRVARDGQGLEMRLRTLSAASSRVVVTACDAADASDVCALLQEAAGSTRSLPLGGVLHAAGAGDKGLISVINRTRLDWMFASKALGAWHLHSCTLAAPLRSLVLFSSIASGLGNVGQANYAAANAALDACALSRRAHGASASSLQLPLVGGAGMGAAAFDERQMSFKGMTAITLDEYAACLADALAPTNALCSVRLVMSSDSRSMLQSVADASQMRFIELATRASDTQATLQLERVIDTESANSLLARELVQLPAARRQEHVEVAVLQIVRELAGEAAALEPETPLMEAGVDSLAATELSSRLQAMSGVALSPTLVFEQPTPRAIASHLLERVAGASKVLAPVVAGVIAPVPGAISTPLTLCGAVGRWVGGCNTAEERWHLQSSSGDAVGGVPVARWTLESAVDVSSLSAAQAACVRHGGFLAGAQRFDSRAFGISPAEAGAMDPQQRLLLELGYEALHSATLRRAALMGGDAGVFVGIERPDWAVVQATRSSGASASVYAVTGDTISIAAGRLSFVLGLQGPCESIDTACSSALAALHGAARAVRGAECSIALAAAVSLKLTPQTTLGAAIAGMLSVDGRCQTFDARANGYVRSEAVGALVLRPQADTLTGGAATLGGSAVRQDGRSASLTAPNGSAQRTLLLSALARAALAPSAVGVLEAHGTGTALGDPTEVGALVAVHGSARESPLVVGAAKASLGHAEAPSGQVGLLKALCLFEGVEAAGNAQLRTLNELVGEGLGLAASVAVLPTQRSVVGNLGAVGVSSFGYSGTIAHAVLSHDRSDTAVTRARGALQLEARATLDYKRRTFAWSEPPHPLLQHTLATTTSSDVVAAFRSPLLGALRTLVDEHIVQGVVIFPGAGYLEMAHVACRAARPTAEGAALRGVFFLQPLALAEDAATLQVECVLRTGGKFEVRSGELVAAELLEGATVHCSGSVAPSLSGAWRTRAIAMAGSCRTRPVDVAALYRGYASIGLQYGLAFRTLARAWAGGAEGVARLSTRAEMSGTRVHPADLDGALQLSAVLAKGEAGNAHGDGAAAEPRLPFAVDEALLRGGMCREQWATVSAQGGDSTLVALAEAGGRGRAELGGFKTRTLGTAPAKAQQRHLYSTEWRVLSSGASGAEPEAALAPVLVLGRSRSFDNDPIGALALGLAPKRSQALIALHSSTEEARALPELEGALTLVQATAVTAPPSALLLITVGAQLEGSCSPLRLVNTGAWGLARAARAEARLPVRCIDIEIGCAMTQLVGATEAVNAAEPELMLRDGVQQVPRLASAPSPSSDRPVLDASGLHLVSGGLGGLGLLAARWLAQQGADGLALASRSGAVAASMQSEWEQLRASAAAALVDRCDVAEEADVCRMMAKMQYKLAPLRGVWHAAGVLADGLLPRLTAEALRHVFGSKAHGAWALHSASVAAELRSCALFSSVAALLGGAGQANYSAANACLDALGMCRRMQGRVATSVQWGAWAEVGMAARGAASERTAAMEASSGFGRIGVAQGLEALREAVQPEGPAVLGVLPVVWSRLLGGGAAVPALLSAFAPERSRAHATERGSAEALAMSASSTEVSLEAVLEMVRRTAGGLVDADAPLMEAGIDSLGAVELRNQLQQAAGESVALPSTLVFDHPTARQLAALLQGSTAESPTVTIPTSSMQEATSVVLAAVRALLPLSGSSSTNMWQYAACGSDLVSTVPSSRWSTNDEQVMALAARAPSMLYGGFLSDAELFDNSFFGISRAEAAVMDPQQRLLLEHGYAVLHDVGFSRVNLSGSDTGVFVGVWASEYADVLASTSSGKSVYAATAATCSVVAGRMSFVLGLMGPCISYDTACSSGLVACHAAMRALQHYECTTALAAGVNMIFSPSASATTGLAGMTSPTGKSYSFDLRADGYARGEACCPAAMKRGAGANPSEAPSVLANAVRQDGRSASLTAPNGTAQHGLLSAALADAALVPAALSLNEAHGTGTALGDPIEVGSLATAVLKKRVEAGAPPLALGGVKANIGHAEPAAGMTGLLKLAIALEASGAAPNAQLRRLNPHVDAALRGSGCALPAQLASLSEGDGGKWAAGGVSSFGYSGTIAHAILSHDGDDTMVAACSGALHLEARPVFAFKRRIFAWRDLPCTQYTNEAVCAYIACWTEARPLVHKKDTSLDGILVLCPSTDPLKIAERQSLRIDAPTSRATPEALQWRSVAAILNGSDSAAPSVHGVQLVLVLAKLLARSPQPPRLLILTAGTQSPYATCAPPSAVATAQGGAWGLARVLRLEHPELQTLSIDAQTATLDALAETAPMASDATVANDMELSQNVSRKWHAARLRRGQASVGGAAKLRGGTHVVTGGLGGLGLRAATLLLEHGAAHVALASRSGRVARDGQGLEMRLRTLSAASSRVAVTACDAADASDVCALLQEAAGSTSIQPLGGVLHAAGAGDKGLISVVNRSRLDWMFASKALGAWHVHSCTMATPLRSFVLFSSIGSGLGNVGQANYAAANAALDACALSRRAHGASASSLQLPLVGGAGMGAAAFDERQMSFKGMAAITLDAYAACLGDALAPSGSLCSVQLVMSSESRSMLQSVADASQPRFTELATRVSENQATRQLERVVDTMSISSKEVSLEMVLEIVRRTAGGAVDADAPLMESGIDSLGAVELRNQLQQAAGENLALPSTLIFDHPTARQLTTALLPLTTSEALPGAEMRASSTSPSSHVTPLATTQAASDRQSSNGPRSISSRVTFIKDSSDRFPPVRPEHPSLRLVRKAKMGTLPSRPPIVLVHGIDGHVDGFGFYRTQCHDHDILALVPADPDAMTDPLQMIDEYTKACVSHFGTSTAFHMIGYSFGAMLARCIAGNVAEAGGCPLGLVFLDPPPFFQAQEKQNVERRRSAARSALLMTLPQVVQDPEVSLEEIINDEFPDLHQVRDAEVVTYIIGEAFATKPLTTVLAELNALNQLINTMAFCAENAMPHMAGCHLHREIPVKVMVALASPEVRSSFFISRGYSAEDLSEECYHATIELQVPGDHFRAVAICATGWHDEFNDALRDFLSAIETTPKEEN